MKRNQSVREYYQKEDFGLHYHNKRYSGKVGEYRTELIVSNFVHLLSEIRLEKAKVLEIAPGSGVLTFELLKKFPQIKYSAIDSSLEMVKYLKGQIKHEHKECKVIQGDGETLPFKDNSFDIVFALRLLIHYENPKKFLEEMARVVKPGGYVLVDCHNLMRLDIINTFYRRFIKSKGFSNVESYYLLPWEIQKKYQTPHLAIERIIGHKFLPPSKGILKLIGKTKLLTIERMISKSLLRFFCADSYILLRKSK